MSEILNPTQIKMILDEYGTSLNYELGQNFLLSNKVIDEVVEASQINSNDTVVEVGSGLGVITEALAKKAHFVIALELDKTMVTILTDRLRSKQITNVKIISTDALSWLQNLDPKGLESPSQKVKLVGAIPYRISSPLIHRIINQRKHISSAIFITQKEFAERVAILAPNGSYLSNFVHLYADTQIVNKRIKPGNFWPPPKANSAILKLVISEKAISNSQVDPKDWSKFLHHGFSQPRKMIKQVFGEKFLQKVTVDPSARPQEITLDQWLQLYREMAARH